MNASSAVQILVVDDDYHARFIMRSVLLDSGYGVTEAANGQAALEAYERVQPDLILLDIMMPGIDGIEVCRRLSADAERRNVPIIMISALEDLRAISQAFEAGAADIINKPYNLAVVLQRLRRLVHAKQTEDAIRRAKHEWEATLDAVSDMVLVTATDGRVRRCNRAATMSLDRGYSHILGQTLANLFGRPLDGEAAGPQQFPNLTGWFLINTYPVSLDDRTEGHVHILRDVSRQHELETARLAAVEALAVRERQYRLLAEHMADVVWVFDPHLNRFTYVSPSAAALSGYPAEAWLTMPLEALVTPASWAQIRTKWLHHLLDARAGRPDADHAIGELAIRCQDGRAVWTEVSTTFVKKPEGGLEIVGVARDITERKRAAEALATQAQVLDDMAEGVNVSTAEGQIVFTNRAFDAMFGYERGELLGRSTAVLNDLPPDENAAFLAAHRSRLESQGGWSGEFTNRRKDGTTFVTRARLSPVTFHDERCWVAVQTDITEAKQTQAWMLNTQKLADLGTLAAGVAHELNSPLQVITGVSQSLLRRQTAGALEPDYLCRNLDVIQRNGWRCAEIVRSLHTYARVSSGQLAPADLNEVVRDTLLLIEHQLRSWSNIAVVTDLAPELPLLDCDRNQFVQVLINLLTNARDAMPDGGEITLSTRHEAGADQLVLRISDTGLGIPEAIRPKLFDPFFTTKPVGKGTGLGLSIVAGIVRAYGGEISVESTLGRGTTFAIRLPVTRPKLDTAAGAPEAAGPDWQVGRFDDISQAQPALPAQG